ncbi:citrate synthase, partial [bacterium]|nr:citrate synthase [bacterium]
PELSHLSSELVDNNSIDPQLFDKFDVKRGLRNKDGSGVLAGLSRISSVIGFHKVENEMKPIDGILNYRGIEIRDVIARYNDGRRYCFEDATFLLLVGRYPSEAELEQIKSLISDNRHLPPDVVDHVIKGIPSKNVMNKFQAGLSALYGYDADPETMDPYQNFLKSVKLLAKLPSLIAYSYLVAFKPGAKLVEPPAGLSIAETFLYLLYEGKQPTVLEASILDLCLVLHAEHGGGNNSTFAARVVTSSESDIYSAMAAAVGSLKGPLHGAANKMVMEMMNDISIHVNNHSDMDELRAYLSQILAKKTFDKNGKFYGLGHAVYTLSDPRALVLIEHAKNLAKAKGREKELQLYFDIAREAPILFQTQKGSDKVIAPNIDFYSGFVYDCLGIPEPIYTPIFGLGRFSGWCAHRIEEIISGKRIIRPAYKYV